MATLAEIRVRETSPETYEIAEQKAIEVNKRMNREAALAAGNQALRAKSVTAKVHLLRDMAGELAKATQGVVACKSGCNHCCHMATCLTLDEAKVIAKETGLKLHMPKRFNDFEAMRKEFNRVPCSMLKDGKCSIYASRPFSCRVHYTMDRDAMLCEIHDEAIRAPSLNVKDYNNAYNKVLDQQLSGKYADIREFFPK